LSAVGDADPLVNAMQMNLDGTFGYPENGCDLGVGGANFQHRDDLILAKCEVSLCTVISGRELPPGDSRVGEGLLTSSVAISHSLSRKSSGKFSLPFDFCKNTKVIFTE
jgi:hypothetical protein